MIRGPLEYVPPVQLEVVNKQKAIPLDENEGIYVRDIKTGKVHGMCILYIACRCMYMCMMLFLALPLLVDMYMYVKDHAFALPLLL